MSKKLDDLLLKQEIFWAQRSRIAWVKHGDKNTNFFHSKVSQRQRGNRIHGIKNANGEWVEEVEEIVEVATNYFDSMFNVGVCDRI